MENNKIFKSEYFTESNNTPVRESNVVERDSEVNKLEVESKLYSKKDIKLFNVSIETDKYEKKEEPGEIKIELKDYKINKPVRIKIYGKIYNKTK